MRPLALACAVWAVSACGGAEGPARFSETWPERTAGYADAHDEWTRSARLLRDFDRVLDVHATFKSPAWRAAYVEKRAKKEMLPASKTQALAAEQRAEADKAYEVELLVATYHYDINDLHKGDRSTWRVVLVDDQGNEIEPVSIERDRREREVIAIYFPRLEQFHVPYVAKFPKTQPLLEGASFSLKIAGAPGGVEMIWRAK